MDPISKTSMARLEKLGRTRLSDSFYMRDFLWSEIAATYGLDNAPDNHDLAIEVGEVLCQTLLEPLQKTFGRIAIRSAHRSVTVNQFGNENGLNCSRNEANYAYHIWDRKDEAGRRGACACIVIPWFADRYEKGADWQSLAWYIHDQLPYHTIWFFPKLAAINLSWREEPIRRIDSYIAPKGTLTKLGMENHGGDHSAHYSDFPTLTN